MAASPRKVAEMLLKQEVADANAERGLLVDRVAVHERAVAERERQQAEHEARVIAAKAQREIDRAQKKIAEETKVQVARRERQITEHAEERASQRAAKEEERRRQQDEIDKELAEGEALLKRQQAEKDAERERAWKQREQQEKALAIEAEERHRSAQKEADLRLEDHRALTVLFNALDLDHSGFIESEEFMWLLLAIRFQGPILPPNQKPVPRTAYDRGSRYFARMLREFDASVNGRISISGLRMWWDFHGIKQHGLSSKALGMFGTKKVGVGSAPAFVAQTLECMRMQAKIEAVTMIQSHVRRAIVMRLYRQQKANNTLPGSQRCAACRIQAFWRMHTARAHFRMMRQASVTISSAIRRRHAVRQYKRQQTKKESDGYNFAARTVHVGGIGEDWEDEEKIAAWFARGGPVLSVALRKREPTADIPNNSWALVAFEHKKTLNNLFSLAQNGDERVVLRADAGEKTNNPTEFVVRRIEPVKAMTSTGSFGKTFQRCVQNLEDRQKKLIREATARKLRFEARELRWRALAAPNPVRAQTKEERRVAENAALGVVDVSLRKLHAKLDGTDVQYGEEDVVEAGVELSTQPAEVVMAEFSDGWVQCCQWPPTGATVHNPSPTLADMEQQGRPYYFNVRSGESRWLPPPSLTLLSNTRAKARHVRAAGAIPGIPRVSGPAAGHIYTRTLQRPKVWHPLDDLKSARQVESARGQQRRLPTAPASPRTGYTSSTTSRQASNGPSKYNAKQRRVMRLSQMPAQMAQSDGAAFSKDDGPVAYMMQWQHQKYLSGPKIREFDCFIPKQGQDGQWMAAEQQAPPLIPMHS